MSSMKLNLSEENASFGLVRAMISEMDCALAAVGSLVATALR